MHEIDGRAERVSFHSAYGGSREPERQVHLGGAETPFKRAPQPLLVLLERDDGYGFDRRQPRGHAHTAPTVPTAIAATSEHAATRYLAGPVRSVGGSVTVAGNGPSAAADSASRTATRTTSSSNSAVDFSATTRRPHPASTPVQAEPGRELSAEPADSTRTSTVRVRCAWASHTKESRPAEVTDIVAATGGGVTNCIGLRWEQRSSRSCPPFSRFVHAEPACGRPVRGRSGQRCRRTAARPSTPVRR